MADKKTKKLTNTERIEKLELAEKQNACKHVSLWVRVWDDGSSGVWAKCTACDKQFNHSCGYNTPLITKCGLKLLRRDYINLA